jgi:glycosyltransferase involved in cell wall biosynthesis
VASLDNRRRKAEGLLKFLADQALTSGVDKSVEFVIFVDDGRRFVGEKRNALLEASRGDYVAFVDDDDWVSGFYLKEIVSLVTRVPDLDCVGIVGEMTSKGQVSRFIHSITLDHWFERGGIYYRPPNHLNPIRSGIAKKFRFPDKDVGEDAEWSNAIYQSGLLKKEILLGDNIMYYYRCR